MLNINSSTRQLALLPLSIAVSTVFLTACNTTPQNNANVTTRTPVIVNPNATVNTSHRSYNNGAYNHPNANLPNGMNGYSNSNNSLPANYPINDSVNNSINNNPINNIPNGYTGAVTQNQPAYQNNSGYQERPFIPNRNPATQNYNQNQALQFPNNYSEPPITKYDKPYINEHINSEKNRYQPNYNNPNYNNLNNNQRGTRSAYRVEPGDNLSKIANRAGVSVSQLASWNNINPNSILQPNTTLYLYNGKFVPARAKTDQNTSQNANYYIVRDGDTLNETASRVGLSVSQLASYNNLSTKAYLISGQKLWLVPGKVASRTPSKTTSGNANKSSTRSSASTYSGQTSRYKVKSGDTLIGIANKLNTETSIIAGLNNFSSNYHVLEDQYITVPASKAVVDIKLNNKSVSYKVQDADTLIGVAKRFDVSVSNLANANNLSTNSQLIRGTTITIPANSVATSVKSSSTNATRQQTVADTQPQQYIVESGDSLGYLASKYRMPVSKIAAANGLTVHDDIYIGQKVIIPARSSSDSSSTTYIVRSGDNLTDLAKRNGITINQLATMNGLSATAGLKIGQIITVPVK